MNDIVYLLGPGSTLGNMEIKNSLRSLELFCKDYRNVFVIGTKPHFLNENVIEIPYKDIYRNKARNIAAKINRAAMDERVSENFMVFNDDYFLLKEISAVNYPYYWKCDLKRSLELNIGEYEKHIKATLDLLQNSNHYTTNFDSHYPIIYNKETVKFLYQNLSWNIPFGYIFKSLYCNYLEITGEYLQDCKISHPYTINQLKQINAERHMFSIEDKAVNVHMSRYIKELYPNKSKFEL